MHFSKKSFVFLDDILPVSENDEKLPFPIIYNAASLGVPVPEGFNAINIYLNGRLDSPLDWRNEILAAKSYVEQGYNLFWELDLGLFEHLHSPMTDQTQYLSIGLSLKHFKDLIWKEFYAHTLGLSLYKGTIEMDKHFYWNDVQLESLQEWLKDHFRDVSIFNQAVGVSLFGFNEISVEVLQNSSEGYRLLTLFCSDASVEYMELIAAQLPGELSVCALFDVNGIESSMMLAQLLSKERFDRVHRAITQGSLPLTIVASQFYGSLGQEPNEKLFLKKAAIGLCQPSRLSYSVDSYKSLRSALDVLIEKKLGFRIVSEEELTVEWDGLDYLVVHPEFISQQGIRKLRGFCAAGGTVVLLGEASKEWSLVPNLVNFSEFFV